MSDFLINQNNPSLAGGIYNDITSSFFNRQAAIHDAKNRIQRDYDTNELKAMQIPEEIAKSKLAQLTAEKDARLLPQQELIASQNLDAEEQFNILRQMRALRADASVDNTTKRELLKNGITKLLTQGKQPSLEQTREVARVEHILRAAEANPTGFDKYLDDAMSAYAMNQKSTNATSLAETKGYQQQVNTLLRTSANEQLARLRASLKTDDVKTLQHLVVRDVRELRARGDYAKADALQQSLADYLNMSPEIRAKSLGQEKTANVGPDGNVIITKKETVNKPTPFVAPSSVSNDTDMVKGALAEIERRKQGK